MNINDLREPRLHLRPLNRFDLELLESSLRTVGQLTPIVHCGGQIVDGFRRWHVMRRMGWTSAAAHEVSGDPDRLRVVCQTRANELSVTDKKAILSAYLLKHPAATAGSVAHQFHWSLQDVEQLANLHYLEGEGVRRYRAGEISLVDVYFLSRLKPESQLAILASDREEEGSVAQQAAELLREERCARRVAYIMKARIRSLGQIEKELEKPRWAGPELIKANSKTALDGWNAALRWVACREK